MVKWKPSNCYGLIKLLTKSHHGHSVFGWFTKILCLIFLVALRGFVYVDEFVLKAGVLHSCSRNKELEFRCIRHSLRSFSSSMRAQDDIGYFIGYVNV